MIATDITFCSYQVGLYTVYSALKSIGTLGLHSRQEFFLGGIVFEEIQYVITMYVCVYACECVYASVLCV